MSRQHQRKRAFNRGTFLMVDGEKYDVSNIVHESTELIPDCISIVIRRSTWAPHLYPSLEKFENQHENNEHEDNVSLELGHDMYRGDSESLSSHDDDTSSSSHSGRFIAQDDDASWSQRHGSLQSINWTPPEKAQLLKMVERSGGPAQVPGAVHVASDGDYQQAASPRKPPPQMSRKPSVPGAVHVDGLGMTYCESSSPDARRDSLDYKPPAVVMDTKQSPAYAATDAAAHQGYLEHNQWRQQQQQQHHHHQSDDDSFDSAQIRAAAAAFDACDIANGTSSSQHHPQHQSDKRMVQVTDDLELPLHGANETAEALQTGNVVTVVCVVCRATLRCISKAQYVLCPECKCLAPLQDSHLNAAGGVGLGLLSSYDQSFRVAT